MGKYLDGLLSLMRDHFTELLLCSLFVVIMVFVVYMSHIHNDSLASKIMDFASGVLGALFLAMKTTSKPTETPKEK